MKCKPRSSFVNCTADMLAFEREWKVGVGAQRTVPSAFMPKLLSYLVPQKCSMCKAAWCYGKKAKLKPVIQRCNTSCLCQSPALWLWASLDFSFPICRRGRRDECWAPSLFQRTKPILTYLLFSTMTLQIFCFRLSVSETFVCALLTQGGSVLKNRIILNKSGTSLSKTWLGPPLPLRFHLGENEWCCLIFTLQARGAITLK